MARSPKVSGHDLGLSTGMEHRVAVEAPSDCGREQGFSGAEGG